MTLLVISPDYASHALPLLTLARAWQRRGQRVVVATGPAMAPLVRRAGMEHTELIMSRGSNAGVIRTSEARDAEARSLQAFFEATGRGMLETLRFQAEQRATDLLWRPVQVARRTMRIVEAHHPDAIVIDHLAFGPSIGLRALGLTYGDVVLGHPTALPVGDDPGQGLDVRDVDEVDLGRVDRQAGLLQAPELVEVPGRPEVALAHVIGPELEQPAEDG